MENSFPGLRDWLVAGTGACAYFAFKTNIAPAQELSNAK